MTRARAALAAFRCGKASVCELLSETLADIAEHDGVFNSFITLEDTETLRETARSLQAEMEAGRSRGPLHGIPVGVKDVIETRGLRTTGGSAAFDDHVPVEDATAVARLRQAGAIIIGKNNTHEFAFGVTNANQRFGQCRNPHDPVRIPGGSSGGSSAAVAAGLCSLSLATDTGSSIRRPAAYCGVVGVKPSYGRVSRKGVFLVSWSLDHVGPIASSVAEATAALDTLCGHDRNDPASRRDPWPALSRRLDEPHGITRAGVPGRWIEDLCDPGVAAAFERACRILKARGIELVEIDPPFREELLPCLRLISIAEASVIHEEKFRDRGAHYSEELQTIIHSGRYLTATQYIKCQQVRAAFCTWLEEVFQKVEAIVSPTMPDCAPEIGTTAAARDKPSVVADSKGLFCSFGAMGGLPSISLPMGASGGMPCGLLLTGRDLGEAPLLRLAHELEKELSA